MSRHLLGVLEPSVVLQVNRDAGRPPGVTSDWGGTGGGKGVKPARSYPKELLLRAAPRYSFWVDLAEDK
jgi:hypothetical protein